MFGGRPPHHCHTRFPQRQVQQRHILLWIPVTAWEGAARLGLGQPESWGVYWEMHSYQTCETRTSLSTVAALTVFARSSNCRLGGSCSICHSQLSHDMMPQVLQLALRLQQGATSRRGQPSRPNAQGGKSSRFQANKCLLASARPHEAQSRNLIQVCLKQTKKCNRNYILVMFNVT
jgi:hypothetical protein